MADKKAKEGVVGVLDPIELGDLRRNPEGIVHVDPQVEINQLCTVVESRLFLGYGGPLAIENQHGLQKALHEDGIYTLSNGQRYVVPHEIHEALGIPLPQPYPPEQLLLNDEVAPGDELLEGEALEAAKARHALVTGRGPNVEVKPAPKPTPLPADRPTFPSESHKK